MEKDCPCCGYPGTPPDDEAFRLRYLRLSPNKKRQLREMAEVLMREAHPRADGEGRMTRDTHEYGALSIPGPFAIEREVPGGKMVGHAVQDKFTGQWRPATSAEIMAVYYPQVAKSEK